VTTLFDSAPGTAGSVAPAVSGGDFTEARQLPDPALDIWVPGKAQPKGSKTFIPVGKGDNKRMLVIESADMGKRTKGGRTGKNALKDWSSLVAQAAGASWGDRPPLDEAVHVVVEFRLARPSSYRVGDSYLRTKPDADKVMRGVLDPLQAAGVLREDSRVVSPWPIKRLCEKGEEAGVRIRVWPLGEWERAGWVLHVADHPVMVPKAGAA
jgi:Holliday junction resolvase RusA-like endonuclease